MSPRGVKLPQKTTCNPERKARAMTNGLAGSSSICEAARGSVFRWILLKGSPAHPIWLCPILKFLPQVWRFGGRTSMQTSAFLL